MFYDNIKNVILELLSSVVYCIIDNYVCANYLYFQKNKPHFSDKLFESITLNNISVIGIPELLMNVISCHGFLNNNKSTVILACCRKVVDYYLSIFLNS